MTIAIIRTDLDAAGLRAVARRARDVAASRRMLALAMVLEGRTRTEAARAARMERQRLRLGGPGNCPVDGIRSLRVHCYSAGGPEGLGNRTGARGPRHKLTEAQEAEFAEWVAHWPGAGGAQGGALAVLLRDEIARRLGVELHERTVGKLLARLNFSRVFCLWRGAQ